MLNLFLGLFVSLSSDCRATSDSAKYIDCTPSDAAHELAHRLCEIVVYEALAPNTPDDAIDTRAEPAAELLCRIW